ncbi:hypothetical protein ACWDDN_22425 [Streptomyces griseoruber]
MLLVVLALVFLPLGLAKPTAVPFVRQAAGPSRHVDPAPPRRRRAEPTAVAGCSWG